MITGFHFGMNFINYNWLWSERVKTFTLRANAEDRRGEVQRNETGCIDVDSINCEDNYLGRNAYLLIYTGFNLGAVIFCITRGMWFFVFCAKISINLHDWMFRSLVRAPTKFFDDNPSGTPFTVAVVYWKLLSPLSFINVLIGRKSDEPIHERCKKIHNLLSFNLLFKYQFLRSEPLMRCFHQVFTF